MTFTCCVTNALIMDGLCSIPLLSHERDGAKGGGLAQAGKHQQQQQQQQQFIPHPSFYLSPRTLRGCLKINEQGGGEVGGGGLHGK